MNTLKTLAAVAAFTLAAGQASACTVYVDRVLGNGNFVNVDLSGCSQTSNYLVGERNFAEIINHVGRIVTGIRGPDNFYKVVNDGDNQMSVVVHGHRQTTRIEMIGDGGSVDLRQEGTGGSVYLRSRGNNNHFRGVIRD